MHKITFGVTNDIVGNYHLNAEMGGVLYHTAGLIVSFGKDKKVIINIYSK